MWTRDEFLRTARTGASREADDVERMSRLAKQLLGQDLDDPGRRVIVAMLAGLVLVRAEPAAVTRATVAEQIVTDFSPDAPVPDLEDALGRVATFTAEDEHAAVELVGLSRSLIHAIMAVEYAQP